MSDSNECPRCGESKPREWTLCRDCLKQVGGEVDRWPDWLHEIRNHDRRQNYRNAIINEREICLEEIESEEIVQEVEVEQIVTRPPDEMAWSYPTGEWGDPLGRLSMPWAPYDDEEKNRAYRKSNNIRR